MNSVLGQIGFLLILVAVCATEAGSGKNKIKIIIPHRINFVHHHHSQIIEIKAKKKPQLKHHVNYHDGHHHDHHHEDESEEEEQEEMDESHDGHHSEEDDEESDASHSGLPYYVMPASKPTKTAVGAMMKPNFLYNDLFHEMRHRPSYTFFGFGGYRRRGRHEEEPQTRPNYHFYKNGA